VRRVPVAAVALVTLALASQALGFLPERAVVKTSADEANPAGEWNAAGNREWISYYRNSAGRPNHYDAFLRTVNHSNGTITTTKLNTAGFGWGGGIDPVRRIVVYQQVANGQSSLKQYRIPTRTRPALPAGVNSGFWEWAPTTSGEWLLFGRRKLSLPDWDRIVLFNRVTLESRRLDETTDSDDLVPGQVNGDWVVWSRCVSLCNVFKYNVETDVETRLPRPDPDGDDPPHQWAPSVTADGTVYLARGGSGCGDSTKIVRFRTGDPAAGTVVATLPQDRFDTASTYARSNPNGSTDVFYDRVSCRTGKSDIYKLNDPAVP
jgi:hypothetical protein